MPSATLTTKGQITIPAEIRKELALDAGDRVEFVRDAASGRYEMIPYKGAIASLKGIVPPLSRPVTLEEMEEAISREAVSKR
jgi:antitoxin PrlF